MHTVYTVFFYQLLNHRRPQRLGPSAFELPPRQAQRQSRHGHQPRLIATASSRHPEGRTEPPGQGWRETAFISAPLLFSLCPHAVPTEGQTWDTRDTRAALPREPLLRRPQETPALQRRKGRGRAAAWNCGVHRAVSFFPFKTNKIYIYIYLFFHVELHQKSVWPHCVASTSK